MLCLHPAFFELESLNAIPAVNSGFVLMQATSQQSTMTDMHNSRCQLLQESKVCNVRRGERTHLEVATAAANVKPEHSSMA